MNSSNQSRLDLVAEAKLNGGQLTSAAQLPAGGLNGAGSLSTLYNDTASNDSKIVTNATLNSISFGGATTAVASNGAGFLGPLQVAPNVGGASGTAPANYGATFSSPTNILLPAIDLAPLGLPGTMLNLGTVTSFDAKIAVRDFVVDVTSGSLPLNPNGSYPQTFSSSALNISATGTTDILVGATVQQATVGEWLLVGGALIGLQSALADQGIAFTFSSNGVVQHSYTIGFGFSTPLPANSSVNDDASNGTLEHFGNNFRLTVPVKFDIVPATLPSPLDMLLQAKLGLSGKLIGQTPFQVLEVPEPSSFALAGTALMGLSVFGRRSKRRP